MEKLLDDIAKFSVPVWLIGLSVWAATAHTIRRVKNGELAFFSVREWVGDIVISSFIGVITYYLCKYAQIDEMLTAAAVGLAAHMGTKAISVFEGLWAGYVERFFKRP